MKKIKKSIVFVSVLGAAFSLGGVYALNGVSAETTEQTIATPNFYMDGASVRYSGGREGLRFVSAIAESEYSAYTKLTEDYAVTTGALIIPASELNGELVLENTTDAIMNVVIEAPVNNEEEGTYEFRGVVSAIPSSEYLTDVMGVGYMQIADKTTGDVLKTVYTSTITRTVSYVAYCESQNTAWYEDLDETEKATVDGFIAGREYQAITTAGGAVCEFKYGYAGQTITVSAPEKENYILSIEVETASGETVALTGNTFTMPAEAVTVTADYKEQKSITYNAEYVLRSNNTIALDAMKIQGATITNVTAVTVNGVAATPTLSGTTLTVPCTASGEVKINVCDGTAWYEGTVLVATKTVSTAEEWKSLRASGPAVSDYIVLTADIDMGSFTMGYQSSSNWQRKAVVDGLGHKLCNVNSNMSFIDLQMKNVTFKNMAFDFNSTGWTEAYNGAFGVGSMENMAFENVYMNINLVASTSYARCLMANTLSGVSLKNVVFNVNLTGSGTVYAGYANNTSGLALKMGACSLENVYVIQNGGTITANTAYGWEKAVIVEDFTGITNIGGSFAVKDNAFYYGDEILAMNVTGNVAVKTNALSTIDLTKVNAELDGKTVTAINVVDGAQEIAFTQDGNVLTVGIGEFASLAVGTTYILQIVTTDGVYYANVTASTVAFEQVAIEKEVIVKGTSTTVKPSELGVEGEVEVVFSNTDGYAVTADVEGDSIALSVSAYGEVVVVLQTADTQYLLTFVAASQTVSTAAEWKTMENNGLSAGAYVVLTNDIDLAAYVRANSASKKWLNSATLDGRGHKVYNFTTMSLFDFRFENVTLKNIALDYTANNWVTQYNGIFICGGIKNATLENVFVNVNVVKTNYARGLFANRVSGLTAKNVVFNVNVTGSGTGDIYADYLNESVMDSGVGSMGNSTIENVYVISTSTLKQSGEYGWDKLVLGTKAPDVTTIGGSFELKEDGLYFAGKLAIVDIPWLGATSTVYDNNNVVIPVDGKISLDMSKVNGATIENVTNAWVGSTVVTPKFESGVLTIPCAASSDVKVYVYDGSAWYEISVFVARTVSTAEEWKALENNGALANEYVALTADIDLGGYNRMNSATSNWRKNTFTLDGQGHKVYNFSTMSLFDFRLENNITIKNIHLDYTATNWVTQYNGVFICGGITNATLENVFVNVTVTKADYARGLFANRVNNLTAKNVVFNVSVTGSGAGDIYADYLNESVMDNSVGVMGNSTIENVYVISAETLKKSGGYGWDKLVVGSKASDVTTIGGSFEVKADGLYYNGTLVKAN